MDPQFLEFLGNFLITAAKGQKNMEDMKKWMGNGLSGFNDITEMYKKFYGLDRLPENSEQYTRLWEDSMESFGKSFQEYLNTLGVVSRKEYLELYDKCVELEKRVSEQEENAKNLRILFKDRGIDQSNMMEGFQEIVKSQTDKFQEIMDLFTGPEREGKS